MTWERERRGPSGSARIVANWTDSSLAKFDKTKLEDGGGDKTYIFPGAEPLLQVGCEWFCKILGPLKPEVSYEGSRTLNSGLVKEATEFAEASAQKRFRGLCDTDRGLG